MTVTYDPNTGVVGFRYLIYTELLGLRFEDARPASPSVGTYIRDAPGIWYVWSAQHRLSSVGYGRGRKVTEYAWCSISVDRLPKRLKTEALLLDIHL